MEPSTYEFIYSHLNKYKDIKRLSKKGRFPEELLLVIYTQKTTRAATRDFYKVKNNIGKYHHQ